MKKESILEALKNAGVELEEDKQKAFLQEINKLNGEDIAKAKGDTETLQGQITELQNELNEYKKGGDKYIDEEELNSLREFKKSVDARELKSKQESAIAKLLDDNKFDSKVKSLLTRAVLEDFKPEFDNDFKITNSDKILNDLKTQYKDFVVVENKQGASPVEHKDDAPKEDAFISGFKS